MKEPVKYHMFERIPSNMAKTFGTIPVGHEEDYEMVLFVMESNLLKLRRQNSVNNGRHVLQALSICLFTVDGYLKKKEYDLSEFISPENEAYTKGLLMSFDPFTNEVLKKSAGISWDLDSTEVLADYFAVPVKCLLRIAKSVEMWTKNFGITGYFDFLEREIGGIVARDNKMDFIAELKDMGQAW